MSHMKTTLIAVATHAYVCMCIYAQATDCRCHVQNYLHFKNFSIDLRCFYHQSKMQIHI